MGSNSYEYPSQPDNGPGGFLENTAVFFSIVMLFGFFSTIKNILIPSFKLLVHKELLLHCFLSAVEYAVYSIIILLLQNTLYKKGIHNILVGNEPGSIFTKILTITIFFIFGFVNCLYGIRGIINSFIIVMPGYDYPFSEVLHDRGIILMILLYLFHTIPTILIITLAITFVSSIPIKLKKQKYYYGYSFDNSFDNVWKGFKITLSNYIYYIVLFFPFLILLLYKR